MTTEVFSLPSVHTGVSQDSQRDLEGDEFREMVETKNMAKNVSLTDKSNNSFISPLAEANSSSDKENTLDTSFNSVQKDDPVEKNSSSSIMPLEGITVDHTCNQLNQRQDRDNIKMPDVSSEQQEAGNTSSQLAEGDTGSHLGYHGKIPEASSELQNSDETSAQQAQGEEGRLPLWKGTGGQASTVPTDQGLPLAHDGDTCTASEQEKSSELSSHLGQRMESDITVGPGLSLDVCSGFPEKSECASSPKQTSPHKEIFQSNCAADAPLEANSPEQDEEKGGFVSSHPSSDLPVEPQAMLPALNGYEQIKPNCQKATEIGDEKSVSREQGHLLLSASEENQDEVSGESWEKNSQATEEWVTQHSPHCPISHSESLAELDVDSFCQQRAAGSGCDADPQELLAPSPGATNDSCGPAHQGLAPVCDKHDREGPAIHEPSGADDNSQPQGEVGAEAVLESERQEEATRNSKPGESTSQPGGAENLVGANKLAKELPDSQSPAGIRDPAGPKEASGAMVLAQDKDLLGARSRTNAQLLNNATYPAIAAEHSSSDLTPREGLLLDVADPSSTRNLVSSAGPVPAAPPEESSASDGSGSCTDGVASTTHQPKSPSPSVETPIEREIRVHLEREELLRRERGLASSRGTQEYVEVCIKPILNQNMAPSLMPKEKERQWAGVKMQREIQRECQREEDLVQLGKVRGAYDHGIPQELQEKKLIFEQHSSSEIPAIKKMINSSREVSRRPSFAEANRTPNMIILDSKVLLPPQQPLPERASLASPFVCLRANSPQSLLEQEVQEVQEREWELQRQRYALYGSSLPCYQAEASDQAEKLPCKPERLSYKKLEVIWPPPSTPENSQANGLHKERSPRLFRRQRNALIQRWESGTIGGEESRD